MIQTCTNMWLLGKNSNSYILNSILYRYLDELKEKIGEEIDEDK